MSSPAVPEASRALAERLADAAGAVARRYFRTPVAVDRKADASPVTIADREAEAAMRAILRAEAPTHGVFGEEEGADRADAEWLWVLDPIDGTKAFISGQPTFGTLVALLHNGRPVLGVIDQPIARERWLGVRGGPTLFNGTPVTSRRCGDLSTATLYATTPEMFQGEDAAAFTRLRAACALTRYGLDCYAYGLLALGFVDVVAEAQLRLYDYAALVPVVEGAGGRMAAWSGEELGRRSDGRVLAAGDPRAFEAARALLQG